MEQTNISQVATVELKALAYDQISQIELCQNNLRVINQELSRRQGVPPQAFPTGPQTSPIEPLPPGSIQKV
jgi:hypothetical protein